MLEELRDDLLFKLDRVFDDESFTIFGPTCHSRVTSIDHMIRFCRGKGERRDAQCELRV